MKAWFFRTLGNIAWDLNGGLDGEHDSGLYNLAIWAWARSWRAEERAAGRLP